MSRKLNIVIMGVNYYGQMASSQRVKNLFTPLLSMPAVTVNNIVVNSQTKTPNNESVKAVGLSYNYKNPFSVLMFLCSGIMKLTSLYDKKKTNIIYQYGYMSVENILFLKTARLLGYKIVYDIVENIFHADLSKSSLRHRFKSWSSKAFLRQTFKNGSLCFGISTSLCSFLKEKSQNCIPVLHLPICVDVEYVYSFRGAATKNLDTNTVKVFYGGSFGFKDGFEYIIRGFEEACEKNPNIQLVLTGKISKQMDGKIQSLIASSKHCHKIKFLGCLPINEYYKEMANSDILCMCRINSEFANYGFPFKLGEYLASGNAVIATNVGDVSRYISHQKNALLINPESTQEICDAILLLSEKHEMRNNLGKQAHKTAMEHFSAIKTSRILYNCIIRLTKTRCLANH